MQQFVLWLIISRYNFTLVFFNNVTNEVVTERVVYRGGGGGGSTSYIYKTSHK